MPTQKFTLEQSLSRKSSARLLLLLAAISGFGLLYFGHLELVGNFSSYQTFFGMIAKRYMDNHFSNVLQPELFIIQWSKPALALVFFPLVSLCAAVLTSIFGGNLDFWGRFVSVAASVATVLLVYRIARLQFDYLTSLLASFFFALSPYVLVYGRNFQNDALALFFLCTSLYCAMRFAKSNHKRHFLVLCALSLAASGTLRIHFLLLAPALLIFFCRASTLREKVAWAMLSMAIPFGWHLHNGILQTINPHVLTTLFLQLCFMLPTKSETVVHEYLFQPSYYYFLLKNILIWAVGPVGFICALRACIGGGKRLRNWIILLALSWSVVLLLPYKFLTEHFYAYATILPMSVLAGIGLAALAKKYSPIILWIAIPLAVCSSLAVAYRPSFHVTPADLAVFRAAQFIRENISQGDYVIASHGSTADLLYYSDHLGWSFVITPHLRKRLPHDMTGKPRGGISAVEWELRNKAYGNAVDWLEYLRQAGARYFVVSRLEDLEENPYLKEHLDAHYQLISGDRAPFCAYRLSVKR